MRVGRCAHRAVDDPATSGGGTLACEGPPPRHREGKQPEATMATPPTIEEGSTGDTVRWAQYLLTRITLSYTQIDGTFGSVTKTAVEKFQTEKKLSVDGIVGPKTWAALGGDTAEPPTLANGSSGTVVEKLQEALNKGRGTFAPSTNPVLTVDGKYGANT